MHNYTYSYKNKLFHKKSQYLKILRKKLFNILINVYDSSNKQIYKLLSFFITSNNWKSTSDFRINLFDISTKLKMKIFRVERNIK
jgi:hypothetical protein